MTNLATVEELGFFLQQSLAEYEPEAEQALALASAAVRTHCRRTFDYVEDDEITLPWQPRIFLPNPPVVSITSVELDGTEVSYQRGPAGSIYPPDATFDSVIRIVYTHGFASIPDEVRLVVLRVASRIFKNPTGRVSFQADSLNYQGMGDVAPRILTGDEAALLKRWRLHRLVSL